MKLLSCRFRVLLAVFIALGVVGMAQAAPLSPAQEAYVKTGIRKAQERFIRRVAQISGASEQVVQSAWPEQRRIIDPVSRMMEVLEQRMGKPLSDDQKSQIAAAETEYRRDIQRARQTARQR